MVGPAQSVKAKFALQVDMPVFDDLAKSDSAKVAKHQINYGTWKHLKIIAIGPKGGKIVGYSKGKPIYAGSSAAEKLAQTQAEHEKHTHVLDKAIETALDWLAQLGISATKSSGFAHIALSAEDGQALIDAFGVKPISTVSSNMVFQYNALKPHVGQPLKPKEEELIHYGAKVAAGDHEKDPFPPLSSLKNIDAGKFAGSHGNTLWKAPDGRRFLFKGENPTIARAEEAVSRIARFVLGENKVPAAKYVKLAGKDGVLIEVHEGHEVGVNHKPPDTAFYKQHFGQLVQHQVLDWLVSNHDSHSGNMLAQPGGALVAIDKGQAWKFIGKDELSSTYNPNPSPPIYNQLWQLFKDGKIKMNPIPYVQEVMDRAAQMSEEQYRALIAPYVATAAGGTGQSPATIEKKLLQRFNDLRSDWETFLSGLTGTQVTLKTQVQKPKDEPAFTVPLEPAAAPPPQPAQAPAPPPVTTAPAKVTGWPITKGTVTVKHPGTIAPSGWPKGYPGPGFRAQVDYKGQAFEFEFADVAGKIAVAVFYPDGSTAMFDSPNKAADSVYLWTNKLPLDMSATEKKAKGISYSATKMLALQKFQAELAGVGIDPSSSAVSQTVQQLEAQGTVTKDTKELSAHDALKGTPDGLVADLAWLPHAVLAHAESVKKTKLDPAIWQGQMLPGQVLKISLGPPDHNILLASSYYSDYGPAYKLWNLGKDGSVLNLADALTSNLPPLVAAWIKKEQVQDHTKSVLASLQSPATPDPGPAPVVEVQKDKAKVEKPKIEQASTGPLAPGTVVKVQKKFPWGEGEVSLKAHEDGSFLTVFFNKTANEWDGPTKHKTISQAAKHVWVNTKGYLDVGSYEKETGKKAPGVNWPFFGLSGTPQPAPVGQPTALPPPAVQKPGAENFETMPETTGTPLAKIEGVGAEREATLVALGPGSVIVRATPIGAKLAYEKQADGKWKTSGQASTLTDAQMAVVSGDLLLSHVQFAEPPSFAGMGPVAGSEGDKEEALVNLNPGSVVMVHTEGGSHTAYEKQPAGQWTSLKTGNELVSDQVAGILGELNVVHAAPKPDPSSKAASSLYPWMEWQDLKFWLPLANQPNWKATFSVPDLGIFEVIPNPEHQATGQGKPLLMRMPGQDFKPATLSAPYLDTKAAGTNLPLVLTKNLAPTAAAPQEPGASNWEWFHGKDEDDVFTKLGVLKPNTPIQFQVTAPEGGVYTWSGHKLDASDFTMTIQKLGEAPGDPLVFPAIGLAKLIAVSSKSGGAGGSFQIQPAPPPPPPAVAPPSEPPTTAAMPSAIQSTVHVALPDALASTSHAKTVASALASMEAIKNQLGGTAADKPALWPAWVPPPGVWIEGGAKSQKLYLTTAISGYTANGEPGTQVQFVVIKDDGSATLSKATESDNAVGALYEVAHKIYPTLTPGEMFPGIEANVFASGESAKSFKALGNGNAPLTVAPEDLSPAAKAGPVKKTMVAGEAIKHLLAQYPEVKIKTAGKPNHSHIIIEGPADFGSAAEHLQQVALQCGLTISNPGGVPAKWYNAPAITVPDSDLQKEVTIEVPGIEAASLPDPQPTYQQLKVGQPLPGDPAKKKATLEALPVGAKVGVPTGLLASYAGMSWTKVPGDLWNVSGSGDPFTTTYLSTYDNLHLQVLPSAPGKPSPDNFETMPESVAIDASKYPAKLFKSWSEYKLKTALNDLPVGTVLQSSGEISWKKLEDGNWDKVFADGSTSKKNAHMTAIGVKGIGGVTVLLPGMVPATGKVSKPKPIKPVAPPPDPAQQAKIQKAKEVAAWAKAHAALSPDVLKRLAHLTPGQSYYARMDPDGSLLLGDGEIGWAKTLTAKGLPAIPVDTPLGTLFKVSQYALQKATPGAETVKGPDGVDYPHGTTFETKSYQKPFEELLKSEPGFSKLSPHVTDPNLVMVKLAGSGAEQKAKAEAIIKKYGIQNTFVISGHAYTMFAVQKAKLKDPAGQTITEVTPTIPPQPKAFQAKALPLAGGLLTVGQPAPNNRFELASLATAKLGIYGRAFRFGKAGLLKNGQVHVVRVQKEGKTYHRIFGDLTRFESHNAKMKSGQMVFHGSLTKPDPHVHVPGKKVLAQDYDPETDTTKLGSASIYSTSAMVASTTAGSALSVPTGAFSLKDTFILDVPVDADVEKELAEAMVLLGKDPVTAMAEPTEDDEALLKKFQVVKHLEGSSGFSSIAEHQFNHAYLDERLKALKGKSLADSAQVLVDHAGKHGVVTDDLEELKAKQALFAYTGGWAPAIAQRLIEGVGPGSRVHRLMIGGELSEGSTNMSGSGGASSDMQSGGGRGTFARIGTSKLDKDSSWGGKCEDAKMIFHPRVFQRTDWWAATGDTYGSLKTTSSLTKKNLTSNLSSSNEVMFEGGLSLQDMAGVVVASVESREQILSALNSAGIDAINGIPIEQFVVLYSGKSRSGLADKLVGLKGVIE